MQLFSSPSGAQGFTGSVAELFLKGFYKQGSFFNKDKDLGLGIWSPWD